MFKFPVQYKRDQVIDYELMPPVIREKKIFLSVEFSTPLLPKPGKQHSIPVQL